MAPDFWFQVLELQALTLLRFIHCRPLSFSRFSPGRGDILETVTTACQGVVTDLKTVLTVRLKAMAC